MDMSTHWPFPVFFLYLNAAPMAKTALQVERKSTNDRPAFDGSSSTYPVTQQCPWVPSCVVA